LEVAFGTNMGTTALCDVDLRIMQKANGALSIKRRDTALRPFEPRCKAPVSDLPSDSLFLPLAAWIKPAKREAMRTSAMGTKKNKTKTQVFAQICKQQ
jgi:hypothetical protein